MVPGTRIGYALQGETTRGPGPGAFWRDGFYRRLSNKRGAVHQAANGRAELSPPASNRQPFV